MDANDDRRVGPPMISWVVRPMRMPRSLSSMIVAVVVVAVVGTVERTNCASRTALKVAEAAHAVKIA